MRGQYNSEQKIAFHSEDIYNIQFDAEVVKHATDSLSENCLHFTEITKWEGNNSKRFGMMGEITFSY